MIERLKRELILERVKKSLPEYKEINNKLDELYNFIKDSCFSKLNEEERNILKKYPELIRFQPNYDIDGRELIKLEKDDNPELSKELTKISARYESSFEEWNYYSYFSYTDKLKMVGNRKVNKDIIVPYLFMNWGDLKTNYFDVYKTARDILISGLRIRYELVIKLNKLDKFLKKDYVTLTLLKDKFVELYNLSK